jgi:hypothetical protein
MDKLLTLTRKPRLVPGAVAYWDCTQVVGQVLPDLSGNGNHATLGSTAGADTNDPTATGQGLVFGGDDFANCDAVAADGSVVGLTVSVVAYATADGWQAIVAKSNSSSATGDGWHIKKTPTPGQYLARIFDASRNHHELSAMGPTEGGWVMLTLVADGTTATLYANCISGTPVECIGISYDLAHAIRIGMMTEGLFWGLVGGVAAVRVYPRALTLVEIAQNHAYFRAKFAPLGVILP